MIDQIEKPKIERVEIGENSRYGKFVVNPLERGFGQTLGNSLRRVLLNSLPGVAATSVRIEGVQHEFSTVPGVKEDVAELILNVKLLSAKLFTEQPKVVTIDAHGPCEVKAGDIKADDEVEIVNPELHIATLSEGAHLQMQITLEKGRGYVTAERNKQLAMDRNKVGGIPIGVIPVDSIFTPIRKVSYAVEDTRVGQVTDYDKLTIEVWTNGSIAQSTIKPVRLNYFLKATAPAAARATTAVTTATLAKPFTPVSGLPLVPSSVVGASEAEGTSSMTSSPSTTGAAPSTSSTSEIA